MPFSCFLFRPRKSRKSAGNAAIPRFPMHWSHGLQHLRHKRPTFAFALESGYTLAFANRIAHSGSQGETGGVSDRGRYHYPRSVLRGSETLRGRVSERQTLPFWGLGWMCSPKTQKACGTAMRLCASLFRRRRGPAGSRCSTAVSCAAPVSFAVRYHCDEGQRGKFVNVTVVILFVV